MSGSGSGSDTINTQESRVNVLIRLVGIIFVVLGVLLIYLTYEETLVGDLVAELIPVFYLCSAMLLIVGLVALIAKYK